jgi:hypothetical protein
MLFWTFPKTPRICNIRQIYSLERVRYEIESVRGFDFFPQTGHVEGVAILNRTSFPQARHGPEYGRYS